MGQGTPASRPAQPREAGRRDGRARVRMAPLSVETPAALVAHGTGNAGLQAGTAPRSGAAERIRQRQDGSPLGGNPGGLGGAWDRERRPPGRHSPAKRGGGTDVPASGWLASRSKPQWPWWRMGQGTPASRPAQPREAGRRDGPASVRMAPLSVETPAALVAHGTGNAGLQAGTAPRSGAAGRTCPRQDGSPLGGEIGRLRSAPVPSRRAGEKRYALAHLLRRDPLPPVP